MRLLAIFFNSGQYYRRPPDGWAYPDQRRHWYHPWDAPDPAYSPREWVPALRQAYRKQKSCKGTGRVPEEGRECSFSFSSQFLSRVLGILQSYCIKKRTVCQHFFRIFIRSFYLFQRYSKKKRKSIAFFLKICYNECVYPHPSGVGCQISCMWIFTPNLNSEFCKRWAL